MQLIHCPGHLSKKEAFVIATHHMDKTMLLVFLVFSVLVYITFCACCEIISKTVHSNKKNPHVRANLCLDIRYYNEYVLGVTSLTSPHSFKQNTTL